MIFINIELLVNLTSYMRRQTVDLHSFVSMLTIHYIFTVYIYTILKVGVNKFDYNSIMF